MDGVDREERRRGRGNPGFVGFGADTTELRRFIKAVKGDKQGRKVVREGSKAALSLFNEETKANVKELPLKKSGKGWRKAMQAKGAYKYKASCNPKGYFEAKTGINYKKKPILAVSHLIEYGFEHPQAGWVEGTWYRWEAFQAKKKEVMKTAVENMKWGWQQVAKTGKAPNQGKYLKRKS